MLDFKAENIIRPVADPLGRLLARAGVSPGAATIAGLVVSLAGAVLIGGGKLLTGALIFAIGSCFDLLDGAVARALEKQSARGALLDSLSDRVGETFMWTGLGYYVADQPLFVVLCLLSLGLSQMISYLRAKAEIAGLEGRGGWMERAERVILYVIGVGTGLIGPMLWAMVLLTSVTVAQRLTQTWSRLPE